MTLRDVAKAAGVAPATVSYVINNVPNQKLRPETRERVLQAVNDLGYIPDANARTMRGGKSFCAGVVINKDLAVPALPRRSRASRRDSIKQGIPFFSARHGARQMVLRTTSVPTWSAGSTA